jgi:flavin reductase (DIM6/NTAB) family NADH-FMN oxidoreductase RutF
VTVPAPEFAAALGRVPSGIFVLTCRRGDDEVALLASWVQQCSFDPPMLSVAVRRGREVAGWLAEGAPFAVNILAEGQKELLSHFGKGLMLVELPNVERRVERPEGRAAVLTEALAVLHCEPAVSCEAGDHHLIVGRIVDGGLRADERPMIHVRKNGLNY